MRLLVGHIHIYDVRVAGSGIKVMRESLPEEADDSRGLYAERRVSMESFLMVARDVRLGWVEMEDDAEILYVYDKGDNNFGYGFNMTDPDQSGWGYAPFAPDHPAPALVAAETPPPPEAPAAPE